MVLVSGSGLVTVTGGKWTTYRVMARDAVDRAAEIGGLAARECITEDLPLSTRYQGQREAIITADPRLARPIHPRLPYNLADVVVAARHELARTVEDVLSRRTRGLLLDAEAAIDSAEVVAAILATELGFDQAWQDAQVRAFRDLALGYRLR